MVEVSLPHRERLEEMGMRSEKGFISWVGGGS